MRPRHASNIAAIALGLMLASCAQQYRLASPPDDPTYAARKVTAARLTKHGELADALIQWKVLETLDATDIAVSGELKMTQKAIRQRAHVRLAAGKRALARERMNEAMREFLAVLAVDPSHEEAFRQLRAIEAERVRKKLLERRPRPSNRFGSSD